MRNYRGWMTLFLLGLGMGVGCGDGDDTPAASPRATHPPQAAKTYGREVKGGRVHQGKRLSISPARSMNAVDVLPALKDELGSALGPLAARDFVIASQHVERTPARSTLSHVSYRQARDGVPIHGTYLNLTLRADAGRRLVSGSQPTGQVGGPSASAIPPALSC